MTNHFEHFCQAHTRELMYDQIPSKSEGTIKILDFFSTQTCSKGVYYIFKIRALQEIKMLGCNMPEGREWKQHFPIRAFQLAWDKSPGRQTLKQNKKYDIIIKYRKENQKKLVFKEITVKELS